MTRAPLFLAAVALISGCSGDDLTANNSASYLQSRADATTSSELKDLATLRRATVKFHDEDVAFTAGYDTQFPAGCLSSPDGGMGYHFLKGDNVGTLDPSLPQFVMYEPKKNGQMKLVGVEFIYPGVPADPTPHLFGQPFQYNYTFSVWALHVWAWNENPAGMYANWNPKVSCSYATTVATMVH